MGNVRLLSLGGCVGLEEESPRAMLFVIAVYVILLECCVDHFKQDSNYTSSSG